MLAVYYSLVSLRWPSANVWSVQDYCLLLSSQFKIIVWQAQDISLALCGQFEKGVCYCVVSP